MYLPKVTSKIDQLIQIYLISLTTANPYDAVIIFFKLSAWFHDDLSDLFAFAGSRNQHVENSS